MFLCFGILLLVASCHANVAEWRAWQERTNIFYANPIEEVARRTVWEANRVMVNEHNLRYEQGLETYSMELNQFSDKTEDEYLEMLGAAPVVTAGEGMSAAVTLDENAETPSSINWVEKGYVTPVKNQRIHGSTCVASYAFAGVVALEGLYFKINKKQENLSEQQLIDCSEYTSSGGCRGGSLNAGVFSTLYTGIMTAKDYEYTGVTGTCKLNFGKSVMRPMNAQASMHGNEYLIKMLVGQFGPTATSFRPTPEFLHYKDGIFDVKECPITEDVYFGVVGYGTEGNTDYWLVKNSWGEKWGMDGYAKIVRGKGLCGIGQYTTCPTDSF